MSDYALGQRIKAARKKQKMTQKELASKLGLATGTIQQYELDKRQPRLEQIQALASALNTSLEDLLGIFEDLDLNSSDSLEEVMRQRKTRFQVLHNVQAIEYAQNIYARDIIFDFSLLNERGQKEAANRIRELTYIPMYRDTSSNDHHTTYQNFPSEKHGTNK